MSRISNCVILYLQGMIKFCVSLQESHEFHIIELRYVRFTDTAQIDHHGNQDRIHIEEIIEDDLVAGDVMVVGGGGELILDEGPLDQLM